MTGDATTRESNDVFLRWHGDGENNLIYLSIKKLVKKLGLFYYGNPCSVF